MELDDLKSELVSTRSKHSAKVAKSSKLVKAILVIGCAAIAGAAQFWTWPAGKTPDTSQVIGIAATLGVLIGGFYVLATETDASDAIEIASKAVESAQAFEARSDDLNEFFDAFQRLVSTYQLCLTMRGAIEQSSVGAAGQVDGHVKSMFELISRQLAVAIGFEQADRWTLGIYKAVPAKEPGKMELKCIAHKRAIECKVEEARVWPEGVGIAGIAYTNSREIVLPDVRSEGLRAVFGPKGLTRPYDADRYVSLVAVPINVAGHAKPWGVVNATSDRSGHFSAESRPGFKTDEPVRALAAFVALAVASIEAQDRARQSSLPVVTTGSPQP